MIDLELWNKLCICGGIQASDVIQHRDSVHMESMTRSGKGFKLG